MKEPTGIFSPICLLYVFLLFFRVFKLLFINSKLGMSLINYYVNQSNQIDFIFLKKNQIDFVKIYYNELNQINLLKLHKK
jgi:hypothetical protein